MSRSLRRAWARAGWVALVALIVLGARANAQGWHEDERYGFKLQPPRGWKAIPLKTDEEWLVAKFQCDEKDRWNDEEGWTWEHQPELMVIAFVQDAIANQKKAIEELKKKREEEKKAKDKEAGKDPGAGGGDDGSGGGDGKDGKKDDDGPPLFEPYENYEDFLDRTHKGGGFYVSAREEGVSNDLPVTKLEVKVEKLTYNGPKHLVAWIFHAPGVDFAVQLEVLEHEYPKHKSEIQSALRSFRAIPRTAGPLPDGLRTSEGGFISNASMRRGTLAERTQKRHESELQLHARAKSSLPAGWEAKDHERFLLLFDTDPAFVDKVAEGSAALLGWAEENLGFIGKDEYVRRPILRVCATEEEKDSLARGAHNADAWVVDLGSEIVTCKDVRWDSGWEMEWVNRRLLDLWLRERDEDVWLGLPSWVRHGLLGYAATARINGKKLQFQDDHDRYDDFREAVQRKQNIPVRALVQMTAAEFTGADTSYAGYWNRYAQADRVVRFLLSPEAARSKQTKTLLFDYLGHLRDVVLELEAEDAKKGEAAKEPATEEEEEELYRKKAESWKASEREKATIQRTFQRTFGSWSLNDWQAFEKAFVKFAD